MRTALYLVEVGEDGSGVGRPPRESETLVGFVQSRLRRPGQYWGRDRDGNPLPIDALKVIAYDGIVKEVWHPGCDVLEEATFDGEPASWMLVRVPEGTRSIGPTGCVFDDGGHGLNSFVELHDDPSWEEP